MSSLSLVTSEYTLSIDAGRFDLRQHESVNAESWLNARRGDLHTARLALRASQTAVSVIFSKQDIGYINKDDTASIEILAKLVELWNTEVGPTDANTAKIAALLKTQETLHGSRNITVEAFTWNTHGDLAGINADAWGTLNTDCDLIILSFQETDALNRNLTSNAQTLAQTIAAVNSKLAGSHVHISSVQLLGLMTIVFVKTELQRYIGPVTTDSSGTGFLRVWGNKGAVLTRFTFFEDTLLGGGAEFSIVNCHLSAGELAEQNIRRRWELKEISNKFNISGLVTSSVEEFDSVAAEYETSDVTSISSVSDDEFEESNVPSRYNTHRNTSKSPVEDEPERKTKVKFDLSHENTQNNDKELPPPPVTAPETPPKDYQEVKESELEPADAPLTGFPTQPVVIVMGDLNYRVDLEPGMARRLVESEQYSTILKHDNLSREIEAHKVLHGFSEGTIGFPPTYKYGVGTNRYVTRVPSYTDRVFYRSPYKTKVTRYDSILNHSSDHLPVDAGLTIELDCIDMAKRTEIIEGALRMVDKAENDARPQVTIEPMAIEAVASVLGAASEWVVLRSRSPRPVNWSIIHGDNIQVTPESGVLTKDHPQVRLLVKAQMKVGVPEVADVLIIRPEGGADSFVTVSFKPKPSVLGLSLDEMSTKSTKHESSANMPPQIWMCVNYLWTRVVKDLFLRPGEPSIVQYILDAVDTDVDFDVEVLDKANSTGDNAGIHSVAEVLANILAYLPEPLIPESLVENYVPETEIYDHLQGSSANVVIYLVGFFQHSFDFGVNKLDALPAIANMLMGRNGNQKKRITVLLKLLAK